MHHRVRRRPVIAHPLKRRALAAFAVTAVAFAQLTMAFRIVRTSDKRITNGVHRSVIGIEHGSIQIKTNTTTVHPAAPPIATSAPVISWQFKPGLRAAPTNSSAFFGEGQSQCAIHSRSFPVAVPSLVLAAVTLLLIAPIRRAAAGHCLCGYDLTNLGTGVCPECGRPQDTDK